MKLLSCSPRLRVFSAAVLGICLCIFSLTGTTANAVAADVAVSYTPAFNTQYCLATPTDVQMNSDGSPTEASFTIYSWSDFPTDDVLVCTLVGSTQRSNGSDYIEPILRVGNVIIHEGDAIFAFQPTTVDSAEGMKPLVLAILTVEASETSKSDKYSANFSFMTELFDAKEYYASISKETSSVTGVAP